MTGLIMMMALSTPVAPSDKAAVETQVAAWRQQRLERLTSESGWLTLAGLVWLKEGTQAVPAAQGTFTLGRDGAVSYVPNPGVLVTRADGSPVKEAVTLVPDAAGEPTLLKAGTFSWHVIKRGDKTGVRIRNTEAETRKSFRGIETYPASASWVVNARWQAFPKAEKVKVPNVLGQLEEMDSPGAAVFSVNGKEVRLQPVLEEGSDELFFIFGDETNKKETYGAGRFLYAPMPKDGHITLDFNHAYNPPCAFTPYATCPIPPAGNRLPVRVEAGEKRYGNH